MREEEKPEEEQKSEEFFPEPLELFPQRNSEFDDIAYHIFVVDFINRKIRTIPGVNIATNTKKFLKLHPDFLLSGVLEAISSETSVAGTAGETTLQTYTIPLNTISGNNSVTENAGNVFRIRAAGNYTTDDATSTVAIACKMGSTTYHTITTTGAIVTNAPWMIDWLVIVKTIGATGKAFSYASAKTNNVNKDSVETTSGGVTIDTTANQAITITATWTSGSAGDTIYIRQFLVELMN